MAGGHQEAQEGSPAPCPAPGSLQSAFLLACAQFVADGVFYAELNELLTRELAADGYSGVEVRVTPMRTEIIIRATRTQNVLGEWRRRRSGAAGRALRCACCEAAKKAERAAAATAAAVERAGNSGGVAQSAARRRGPAELSCG